jgi:hypothetical protein
MSARNVYTLYITKRGYKGQKCIQKRFKSPMAKLYKAVKETIRNRKCELTAERFATILSTTELVGRSARAE